ncbi:putative germin-like protein 2-1 [Phalaenopsis equestris]|uniref:putative germin-like protein 2-1 n=1 Tax=Phalaenopsis equestris TaxID=78828 RepID=UPI0009E4E1DB|nr:putative germin-like protein 2-1 [Phalaenopsis equestris]
MASNAILSLLLAILSLASYHTIATDPGILQDFCVADNSSTSFVNGNLCKNPSLVTADDFFYAGLARAGNTTNQLGSVVTPAFVQQFPGANTLGNSMARIDFAPYGVNPPHTHPRASEILTVLKGELIVGFVTSNPDYKLFTKIIHEGEMYVFPQGLVHFQINIGKNNAVALAALSSQNPGVVRVANAAFGSNPSIIPIVLEKAFQLDENIVRMLQAKFSAVNN